jgi:hypothetical protein
MEAGGKVMTQHEAKKLTLEVWRYLAEHPWIRKKSGLPKSMYKKIEGLPAECPLCSLFMLLVGRACPLCKAGEGCGFENSAWGRWEASSLFDTASRKAAAERIVEIVAAWEPEKT